MADEFDFVFARLKEILKKYASAFTVKPDTDSKYGLYAQIGPATLKMWDGKMKKPAMPVAWVEIGKAYVSYHLMGVYGNTPLLKSMSKELKARMQGRTVLILRKQMKMFFRNLTRLLHKVLIHSEKQDS